MEMSTWNFCTNSKLFPPPPPLTPPLFGLTADAYAPHFECGVHFWPSSNSKHNWISCLTWPYPDTLPPLHFDPPPSPLPVKVCKSFHCFALGLRFAQAAGEKYLMRFPLASIHANLRSENWNLGKYPPRLRLLLAHTVKGSRRHGMTQVQGRGSFGLEGICLCQIFAYKLIQKRARVLNRAQIALLNTHAATLKCVWVLEQRAYAGCGSTLKGFTSN